MPLPLVRKSAILRTMGKRGRPATGTRAKKATVPKPGLQPAYRRALVDYDYLDKLDPEAMRFLSQFTDEYYAADFRYDEPLHSTPADRRDAYNRQNANRRDSYALTAAGGLLTQVQEDWAASGSINPATTPKYLSSEEYRMALEAYRKLADTPSRSRTQEQSREILGDYLLSIAHSGEVFEEDTDDE